MTTSTARGGATATADTTGSAAPANAILAGIAGGAAGGMVFGMMMQMMGRIPMIASLVGSGSTTVGWAVHLAVSMVLGAGFGLLLASRLGTIGAALGLGAVYGMVWWLLGALLLMPLRLGMPVFHFDAMAWQSLMGHVMFGMVLGVVARAIARSPRAA